MNKNFLEKEEKNVIFKEKMRGKLDQLRIAGEFLLLVSHFSLMQCNFCYFSDKKANVQSTPCKLHADLPL